MSPRSGTAIPITGRNGTRTYEARHAIAAAVGVAPMIPASVMSAPEVAAAVACSLRDGYPPIATHRILDDIEAKRSRVTQLAEATADMNRLLADQHATRVAQAMAIGRARAAAVAVKLDAAAWRDHPGYRAEWRLP
jgi:hypothetical protein